MDEARHWFVQVLQWLALFNHLNAAIGQTLPSCGPHMNSPQICSLCEGLAETDCSAALTRPCPYANALQRRTRTINFSSDPISYTIECVPGIENCKDSLAVTNTETVFTSQRVIQETCVTPPPTTTTEPPTPPWSGPLTTTRAAEASSTTIDSVAGISTTASMASTTEEVVIKRPKSKNKRKNKTRINKKTKGKGKRSNKGKKRRNSSFKNNRRNQARFSSEEFF